MSGTTSSAAGGEGKLVRRIVTFPLYVAGLGLWLALLAPLLALALCLDLATRRPLPLVRTLLFFGVYLSCEVVGLALAGLIWVRAVATARDHQAFLDDNFRLQCWWATTIGRTTFWLYSVTLQVEGDELLDGGPILLLPRHSSVADTVIPTMLVAAPHRVVLRYVLKRELLWDPCLDVVGNRLPNYFVHRGTKDAREADNVARLADGLDASSGVLIYPEGTRFTRRRRQRLIEKRSAAGDSAGLAVVQRYRNVLPPRLGGTLALLDAGRQADVVFCAHTGLEGAATFGDLARGELVGATLRIKFWRVPAQDRPDEPDALKHWLHQQWDIMDEFVSRFRSPERQHDPDAVPAPAP